MSELLLRSGELLTPPYFSFMQESVAILQQHPRHALQFEPVLKEHFSCTGCGLCCQRPWLIGVPKDYVERWENEFGSEPSGRYRNAFEPRPDGDARNYANIRRKEGTNECLFLMDDRRCWIHATYGEAALADVCRDFPRYEGWFGSFLGKFMLNSCPEIQDLAGRFPGIRYQLGIIRESQWEQYSKSHRHPLGLYQGYLWLGLQLDLYQDSRLTAVETLRALGRELQTLAPLGLPLPETLLAKSHTRLRRQTVETPAPLPAAADPAEVLGHLMVLIKPLEAVCAWLEEIRQGWRAWPRLDTGECALLNGFLRTYLGYRALTANFYTKHGQPYFYQAYFLLAVQVAILQWLAMYYRGRSGGPLSQEHLLRAVTLIGYRYEHAGPLLDSFSMQDVPASLAGIGHFLSFDFGAEAAAEAALPARQA